MAAREFVRTARSVVPGRVAARARAAPAGTTPAAACLPSSRCECEPAGEGSRARREGPPPRRRSRHRRRCRTNDARRATVAARRGCFRARRPRRKLPCRGDASRHAIRTHGAPPAPRARRRARSRRGPRACGMSASFASWGKLTLSGPRRQSPSGARSETSSLEGDPQGRCYAASPRRRRLYSSTLSSAISRPELHPPNTSVAQWTLR